MIQFSQLHHTEKTLFGQQTGQVCTQFGKNGMFRLEFSLSISFGIWYNRLEKAERKFRIHDKDRHLRRWKNLLRANRQPYIRYSQKKLGWSTDTEIYRSRSPFGIGEKKPLWRAFSWYWHAAPFGLWYFTHRKRDISRIIYNLHIRKARACI